MSAKSLVMMFFMVIIFPIIIICYNTGAFFVITSLILMIGAIANLKKLLEQQDLPKEVLEFEEDLDEELGDIGELLGINARKVSYGFMICMDIIVITYFVYALMLTQSFLIQAIAIILIADWAYDIITIIDSMINEETKDEGEMTWKDILYDGYLWAHNLVTMVFIVIVFFQYYI